MSGGGRPQSAMKLITVLCVVCWSVWAEGGGAAAPWRALRGPAGAARGPAWTPLSGQKEIVEIHPIKGKSLFKNGKALAYIVRRPNPAQYSSLDVSNSEQSNEQSNSEQSNEQSNSENQSGQSDSQSTDSDNQSRDSESQSSQRENQSIYSENVSSSGDSQEDTSEYQSSHSENQSGGSDGGDDMLRVMLYGNVENNHHRKHSNGLGKSEQQISLEQLNDLSNYEILPLTQDEQDLLNHQRHHNELTNKHPDTHSQPSDIDSPSRHSDSHIQHTGTGTDGHGTHIKTGVVTDSHSRQLNTDIDGQSPLKNIGVNDSHIQHTGTGTDGHSPHTKTGVVTDSHSRQVNTDIDDQKPQINTGVDSHIQHTGTSTSSHSPNTKTGINTDSHSWQVNTDIGGQSPHKDIGIDDSHIQHTGTGTGGHSPHTKTGVDDGHIQHIDTDIGGHNQHTNTTADGHIQHVGTDRHGLSGIDTDPNSQHIVTNGHSPPIDTDGDHIDSQKSVKLDDALTDHTHHHNNHSNGTHHTEPHADHHSNDIHIHSINDHLNNHSNNDKHNDNASLSDITITNDSNVKILPLPLHENDDDDVALRSKLSDITNDENDIAMPLAPTIIDVDEDMSLSEENESYNEDDLSVSLSKERISSYINELQLTELQTENQPHNHKLNVQDRGNILNTINNNLDNILNNKHELLNSSGILNSDTDLYSKILSSGVKAYELPSGEDEGPVLDTLEAVLRGSGYGRDVGERGGSHKYVSFYNITFLFNK